MAAHEVTASLKVGRGDIASASLVGQEAAGVEVANTMEAGGLVGGC